MSAYIHGTFKNADNVDITVEIGYDNEFYDEEYIINGDDKHILFSGDDPVVIEYECDDMFSTLIKSSCSINLISDIYLGDKLFANTEDDIKVRVKKGDSIMWVGYIEPNTYSQPWAHQYEEFEVNCADYLSIIQYKYPTDKHSYANLLADTNIYSFKYYIQESGINDDYIVYYDNSRLNGNKSVFDDFGVSYTAFLGDGEDKVMSFEDIFNEILQYCNLHMIMINGDIYIFSWGTVKNTNFKFNNIFNTAENKDFSLGIKLVDKNGYASDDTNLSIDEVYNRIEVKCNLDEIDELIPNITDDLENMYERGMLYMTELGCVGSGSSAQAAFKALVRSPLTTNPNSVDANTDYDAWFVQDWFIKTKRSSNYQPYYKGQPIENYLNVISGYNTQYKVMELLRNNRFMPAYVSIGKSKDEINHNSNDTSREYSSIEWNDYFVISVNGNGIDSDEESTNIDTANAEASDNGNKGLLQYVGGTSGIFSPTSSDVTNYLVISGSIILAPLMNKSGWGFTLFDMNHPNSPNITLQEQQEAFENGAIIYSRFMVPGRTNDNAYYTQQFWKSFSTSTQVEPANNELYLYPFVDYEGNRLFNYNYSFDGENYVDTDLYNKLPVLECELKIGNKYAVEITTNTNSNRPNIEWRTYDSCPFLKNDDGTYSNVRKTTFTIGFDPEKGQPIIGKEYDFTNNANGRLLPDAKGITIPIKNTDALSGNVEFKIKGIVNTTWNDVTRRHPTLFRHTKFYDHYKTLLSHVSAIWIKNFHFDVYSDTGGKDVESQSNDLVYMSNETHKYMKKRDNIEFNINTMPDLSECVALGLQTIPSNTNVVNMSSNMPVTTIKYVDTNETNRPEKLYVDEYWRYYNQPKVKLTTLLHNLQTNRHYIFFDQFKFNQFGNMITTAMTYYMKENTMELTCRQI